MVKGWCICCVEWKVGISLVSGTMLVYLCGVWWMAGVGISVVSCGRLFIRYLVEGWCSCGSVWWKFRVSVWCMAVGWYTCVVLVEGWCILVCCERLYLWCLVVCWCICVVSAGSLVYLWYLVEGLCTCGVW